MPNEREDIALTVEIKTTIRDFDRTLSALLSDLSGLAHDTNNHPGFLEAAGKTEFLSKLRHSVGQLAGIEKDVLTLHEQLHSALKQWRPPAADEDERRPRR